MIDAHECLDLELRRATKLAGVDARRSKGHCTSIDALNNQAQSRMLSTPTRISLVGRGNSIHCTIAAITNYLYSLHEKTLLEAGENRHPTVIVVAKANGDVVDLTAVHCTQHLLTTVMRVNMNQHQHNYHHQQQM